MHPTECHVAVLTVLNANHRRWALGPTPLKLTQENKYLQREILALRFEFRIIFCRKWDCHSIDIYHRLVSEQNIPLVVSFLLWTYINAHSPTEQFHMDSFWISSIEVIKSFSDQSHRCLNSGILLPCDKITYYLGLMTLDDTVCTLRNLAMQVAQEEIA